MLEPVDGGSAEGRRVIRSWIWGRMSKVWGGGKEGVSAEAGGVGEGMVVLV